MSSGTSQAPAAGPLAAYALLSIPLTLTALPVNILLPDFYAGRTGLALTTIGLVLLATRLFDAISDPLLGAWVDRQKARNSYLTPIFVASVPLAGGFVLLFNPPGSVSGAAGVAWLGVTLVAAYLGYSLASVAYQAWGAELAHDDAGRARVTGVREGAGLVGVLLGGSVPVLAGMHALAALFVVILAAALVALWRFAPQPQGRARVTPASNPFAGFLIPLGTSRLRWLLGVFTLNAIAPAVTATVFQFFVIDRLGLRGAAPWLLALYFLAGAASMPLWIRLARHLSLHAVWLSGMLAAVVSFIWAYWLAPGDLAAFAAICVLSGFAFGADLALPPALLARVIDANGHQKAREGAYFGLWNLVNKLCLALAGGVALPLLEALGYARGARDPDALNALAIAYAVVPCVLKLGAALLLFVAWRDNRF